MYPYRWPKGAGKFGYLSTENVAKRFEIHDGKHIHAGGFEITYSVAMERGYYPSALEKPCQDSYLVGGFGPIHWLCVFDGHGPTGHEVRNYLFYCFSVSFVFLVPTCVNANSTPFFVNVVCSICSRQCKEKLQCHFAFQGCTWCCSSQDKQRSPRVFC